MSTYSDISEDYTMFENKAEVKQFDSIYNHVSVNDMYNHMYNVLKEYEYKLSKGEDATINPMSGRVHMFFNGVMFEIPEMIQKNAMEQYLNSKYAEVNNSQPVKVVESDVEAVEKFMLNKNHILYIIIICLIVWYVYKHHYKNMY